METTATMGGEIGASGGGDDHGGADGVLETVPRLLLGQNLMNHSARSTIIGRVAPGEKPSERPCRQIGRLSRRSMRTGGEILLFRYTGSN